MNKENCIDPASRFYAKSIDSYLTKKTLLELELHSIRLDDASDVIRDLETDNLRMRLKVTIGNIFWTSVPFAIPRMKGNSVTCDFKQVCKVRVDPNASDYVTISLHAIARENDRLPDALKTLKKELKLGYIKIVVADVQEQKKLSWVPLNNGLINENPENDKKIPMLALNMRMMKDVTFDLNVGSRELSGGSIVREGV